MPSYLSPDARNLITGMLAVDPVKRITIPEIIQHPFFQVVLPRYLQPLPPPPGPVLGTLSALVTPGKALDFEIIDGLGRIEEDVVEELALRMDGVDKEDIWECLRRDDGAQGNAVRVAYMLLRDKRRLGRDCKSSPSFGAYSISFSGFSGSVRRTGTRCTTCCYGRMAIYLDSNPPSHLLM
jgi:carbon catabolite-derepressing protein kinase